MADDRKWHVLHFINKGGSKTPQKYIDAFNDEGHSLELFAPIVCPAEVVKGRVVYKEQLLTYYYVFVKGVFEEIKELCSRHDNGLSFLLDRGSEHRYATVSDSGMENFRIYTRAFTNMVPFFNIEDVELSRGDLVEVVGGDFDGLKGRFMPRPRSNRGNLVIAVTDALGAVAWDVSAKCIRILEFADDTRRQYDLIDSFIPKLLPILRKFHTGEELSMKEKTQLDVFNRRMGVVSLANHKAEAKLLATLVCVQFMLGDISSLGQTQKRLERRRPSLTNRWTIALVELMIGATFNDMQRLREAYVSLPSSTGELTATQRQLIEEFKYYLRES